MKLYLTLALFLGSLAFAGTQDYNSIQDFRLIPVEAIDAYEGPENRIKVGIEGYLPDTCYGQPKIRHKRGKFKNVIYVYVYSYVQEGPCAQVIDPFEITADLGAYQDGGYTVIIQPNTVDEMRDTVVVD